MLVSVRQVMNGSAQVTLGQQFDPFGGVMASGGGGSIAFGFAGEEQGEQTGQMLVVFSKTITPQIRKNGVLDSEHLP